MVDPFQKVKPGDSLAISATAYNAMLDAAMANMRRPVTLSPSKRDQSDNFVLIINNSGADVGAFEILGIDGVVFGPDTSLSEFQFHPILKGVTPQEKLHKKKFVIVQEPIENGKIGRACIIGMTPAKIKVEESVANTPEEWSVCGVVDSERGFLQASGEGVASVIWIEEGAGEKWAMVLLGGVSETPSDTQPLSGVVVEAIAPGQTGRVRIYGRNYSTTDSDGNAIEPVYDLIICDELAGAQNEFPEQLLPGTVLTDIRGPFRRPRQGGNDNETESYYVAINTEGVYTGILASDVTGPDAESTIQVKDANGDVTTMTIHSYYIASQQTIGTGTGVMVARQQTDGGLRLVVIKSRYAVTLTEPPT